MRSTRRLTTAQALVTYLANQSVERDGRAAPFFGPMLGIFGHGNVGGVGEALEAYQKKVRFIPVRNEQAMVHAAAAYAWNRRRMGALACTASVGPGATNMVTGAAGATINRLPVLLLPGDVFSTGRHRPVLQQLENPADPEATVNDALRPVSRFWTRIVRPQDLLDALPEAMRVLTSVVETGAVTVCLPQDTQVEAADWDDEFLAPRTWAIARPEPAPASVDSVVRLIAAARRPMIVAGGGVRYSEAESELASFARSSGVPVAETQAGKGSLNWDHPMNLGPIGATGGLAANRYAEGADLVVSIGTRLADFTTASSTVWQAPGVRFVGINVDPVDAAKADATALVGDARQTLRALQAGLEASRYVADGERLAYIASLRAEWNAEVERVISSPPSGDRPTQAQVIAEVNRATESGGTVVCAAGSMPGDLHKLWRATSPDDYHVEYGYSCMGYEISGGLGVKLSDPARRVHVLVGDGSYLMMNSEIVTSIQERLPLTIVLVDSQGYASISALAESMGARNNFNLLRTRDASSGALDGPPPAIDFVAHAASMGAHAVRARTLADLTSTLAAARDADRTTVVVVEVDDARVPGYGWWDVPVAQVSDSESVRAAHAKYERDLETKLGRR